MPETESEPRRRGRPRPQETIDRDEKILAELAEGQATRNALAKRLELDNTATYLALDRLRKQGRVRKCAGDGPHTIWALADGQPCQ